MSQRTKCYCWKFNQPIIFISKDDYIGGTYNVLITVLIGVFDHVDIYTTEFILNIQHARLSTQASPRAHAAARVRSWDPQRAHVGPDA